jgi:hypothetical protein
MPSLVVPTPTLKFDAVAAGVAPLEKPIEVRTAKVILPDGSEFAQANLGTAGFFVYRKPSAATTELWNEDLKQWQADPGAAAINLKPKPLIFKEGDPLPWQAPLVAAGQKDKNDKDQFKKAKFGFPVYFFRTFFSATINAAPVSGLSNPSAAVSFVSALDAVRAGVAVGEDQTPKDATEITVFLRDAGLVTLGSLTIRAEGSSARVELSNSVGGAPKAVLRLRPNGDVEILPGGGGNLIVGGPLLADRVFYQPADAVGNSTGGRKWLLT